MIVQAHPNVKLGSSQVRSTHPNYTPYHFCAKISITSSIAISYARITPTLLQFLTSILIYNVEKLSMFEK